MTADKYADEMTAAVEKRLKQIYTEMHNDASVEVDRYYNGWDEVVVEDGKEKTVHHQGWYERKDEQYKAFLRGEYHDKTGKYTDAQMWARYVASQEGRGQYYKDLRDNLATRYATANVAARDYVNGVTPKVYQKSYNEVSGLATRAALQQGHMVTNFGMMDETTLRLIATGRLRSNFRELDLVFEKDKRWNIHKLENAFFAGWAAGDNYERIAQRFMAVENLNRTAAMAVARTSITSALNAGKQDKYNDLKSKGVTTTKIWEDVHDSIPPEREAHWEASGQEVPTDEPFIVGGEELMYPGDPNGSGWNIYNCRCRQATGRFIFGKVPD